MVGLLLRLCVFCVLVSGDTDISSKKVGVKEVVIDSPVTEVHWCGPDSREVLVRSRKGRLYRSNDFGENWSEITDSLLPLLASGGSKAVSVTIEEIMGNQNDVNLVVLKGRQHPSNTLVHFVSEDAGLTFRVVRLPSNVGAATVHNLVWHPTDGHKALVSVWSEACESGSSRGPCKHSLYVTKDSLRSFSLVQDYVVQFGWGSLKHKQQDRIYSSHYRYQSGDQPRLTLWTSGVDFSFTDDLGYANHLVVDQGNKFLISDEFIFVAKAIGSSSTGHGVRLEVSSDGGKTFKAARMPEQLEEKAYTILDTSEGGVIIHVNHGHVPGSSGQGVGHVYVSDAAGVRYALSLPGNLRSDGGECEFTKVLSLEGLYLANMWDDTGYADDFHSFFNEEDEESEFADGGHSGRIDRQYHGKDEVYAKTVVTFDKGGKWYYLSAPKVDSLSAAIDCGASCSLHLHGLMHSRLYAPFYSTESAVGLVLGTGNVGSHLRYEPETVNTYLSRDGGLTWLEIHKGAFIYEFGDHGGLIVMADDLKRTKQVVFSWNEGESWFDFDVATASGAGNTGGGVFQVDNIITEPQSTSVKFVMYGSRGDTGVLFHMDFSSLNQPVCKGIWAAGSAGSDYEQWSPSDGSTTNCLLGKQLTYTRRKRQAECFNPEATEKPVNTKVCTCTMEDYMCELGFARDIGGAYECKPHDLDKVYLPEEIHCTSSGWFHADAYRKVLGDQCQGGFVPEKVAVPCPPSSPFSRGAIFVLGLVFFLIAAFTTLTLAGNNERLRRWLEKLGINVQAFHTIRYSTLGTAWMETEDVYDRDAPKLVSVAKSDNTAGNLLIDLDTGSPRRAGGLQAANQPVPRLQAPNLNSSSNNELNDFA